MMARIRRRWQQFKMRLIDPALDALGASVLGTLAGRSLLFGLTASSAIAAGAYSTAALIVFAIGFDVFIHLHILVALRDLMAYRVMQEINFA